MTRFRSTVRILAVALGLTLFGVACSRVGFVYDRADWLAYRWADGLLDASDAQAPVWRDRFRRVMEEHRETLLPEVVLLLGLLEQQAERGLDRPTLTCWLEAVEQSYGRHARLIMPTVVAVLQGLDPDQVDHLATELAERNVAYRENYLPEDPADRQQARIERIVDRVERWTGELDAGQSRLVEQAARGMRDIAPAWFAYRLQQQGRLLALLREDAPDPDMSAFLYGWWVELAGRPARLAEDAEYNRDRVLDLLLALDDSLAAGQRAEFVDEVRTWRTGFEAVDPGAGRLWRARGTQPVCAAVTAS